MQVYVTRVPDDPRPARPARCFAARHAALERLDPAIGMLFDNLGFGIAIGLVFGIAFGVWGPGRQEKADSTEEPPDRSG